MDAKKQTLKAWRNERGLTLEAVEKLCRWSKKTISAHENSFGGPDEFYSAMAQIYGIHVDQIDRSPSCVYEIASTDSKRSSELEALDFILRDWDAKRLASETSLAMLHDQDDAAALLVEIKRRRKQQAAEKKQQPYDTPNP